MGFPPHPPKIGVLLTRITILTLVLDLNFWGVWGKRITYRIWYKCGIWAGAKLQNGHINLPQDVTTASQNVRFRAWRKLLPNARAHPNHPFWTSDCQQSDVLRGCSDRSRTAAAFSAWFSGGKKCRKQTSTVGLPRMDCPQRQKANSEKRGFAQ